MRDNNPFPSTALIWHYENYDDDPDDVFMVEIYNPDSDEVHLAQFVIDVIAQVYCHKDEIDNLLWIMYRGQL